MPPGLLYYPRKTKRADCIRLTSSKRKEVKSVVIRLPFRQFVVTRVPAWYPRFVILGGGALTIAKQVHELNEDILDKEVRLIGAEEIGRASCRERV